MTDRHPRHPEVRRSAPEWVKTETLRPEAAGVDPEAPEYLPRHHDLVLATNMLAAGLPKGSRLGLLYGIGARLRDLGRHWVIEEEPSSRAPAAEDLTRLLLRTAEEAPGIPCSTSGLLYGLDPAPPSASSLALDGQHQLLEMKDELHLATGSGKSWAIVAFWTERLYQRLGRLNRHGAVPTAAEVVHIADEAHALSALLLDLTQRLLTSCVKCFGHFIALPPNDSSPCGVLRLAVPRVPRAPGTSATLGPTKFALAA
ncbi:hypothetical protein ABZW18_23715 [Streptomyces sp. NPDC004647]|uniref:hypothetical protein n=1 Tax=Streptomyces sp. NPDC004647 TaxID=3154671 RepID=UPI0033A8FEF1